jgi:hypothetical protein
MKKTLMVFLAIGVVAAGVVGPAWGQGTKVNFSLNGGVQTNIFNGSSFDRVWFTLDARAGILVTKSFEISPEFMGVFHYGFEGGPFGTILYPGVMLNFRSGGGFFVGAGAVLPWAISEGSSDTGRIAPKVNVGYSFGNIQLTAYFIAWNEKEIDFLDVNFAGVTVGYRF